MAVLGDGEEIEVHELMSNLARAREFFVRGTRVAPRGWPLAESEPVPNASKRAFLSCRERKPAPSTFAYSSDAPSMRSPAQSGTFSSLKAKDDHTASFKCLRLPFVFCPKHDPLMGRGWPIRRQKGSPTHFPFPGRPRYLVPMPTMFDPLHWLATKGAVASLDKDGEVQLLFDQHTPQDMRRRIRRVAAPYMGSVHETEFFVR